MTDPVFAPTQKPPGTVAPGGAELVYLRETLYVMKGVYQHPLTGDADAPLPPHRWALVNEAEKLYFETATSDAQGITTILKEDPKGSATGEWTLWLIPIFDDKGDTSEVAKLGEVWIDVDKNQWVRTSSLPDTPHIESRRLLRIPRWTSARKAAFGGGFRDAPPGAADFATTGKIKTSELAPHGTRDKPWLLAIDHGWLKTFVQFRHYDPQKKKDVCVPQGLVVEALATNAVVGGHPRMGASSVRRDDGSIYLLHARDEASSTNLDYQWRTPPHSTFTYDKGTYASEENRMRDFSRLEKEYPLPDVWHSKGTEAWEGPADSSASARKQFSAIRTKGSAAASPLCFHLDDVVLCEGLQPIKITGSKIGIYTALGALHDPKKSSADKKDLPYSKLAVKTFPLRAEDAAFRRGQGATKQTLWFDYEGELYELADQFVRGVPGNHPHVGSRAAEMPIELADNRDFTGTADITTGHRLFLLDARWVRTSYQGKTPRLAHVVCYVSAFIDGAELNAKNADAVEVVEQLLMDSMNRWDGKHPGVDDKSLVKEYAIIPEKGVTNDSTLVRVRHVFGVRSAAMKKPPPVPSTNPRDNTDAITVRVDSQPGRATGGRIMRLYCLRGNGMDLPGDPAWLLPTAKTGTRPYSFEPQPTSKTADPLDGGSYLYSTIAHEYGHEAGLLDEYLEGINITATEPLATQFVPMFHQWGIRARPYYLDSVALMKSDYAPRLRYVWNYLDRLNEFAFMFPWASSEKPFVAQYVMGKKTLRHAIHRTGDKATRGGPWTATTGTHNLCNLSFYPTSEDEGTIGPMFLADGKTLAKSFDGLLVVHPMFWVRYGAKVTGTLLQWDMFAKWATRYFSVATTAKFAIETAGVDIAKRVAIVFQPRFEFGPIPSSRATRSDTTLELLLHEDGGNPSVTTGTPPVLSMDAKHVGNWILRYAINRPAKLSPNDDPTKASDLTGLATALAALLGRTEVGKLVTFGAAP